MWTADTANTQAGSILPRQSASIRATGGERQAPVAPLHKGNDSQRPGIGGDAGYPRKVPAWALACPHNLFRHRSDTIGNVVVSKTLDKWSEWQDLNLRPPRPERCTPTDLSRKFGLDRGEQ